MISVIIPAYNEEDVIGRCLESVLSDAHPGEFEVIVACNGCTDRTAEIASAFREVLVLETPVPSKSAALDMADSAAVGFPRFYVDADVEIDTRSVRRVAEVLESGAVLAASPRPRFDLAGRPWLVRNYVRTWSSLPYAKQGMVGSGVYALSAAGRRRFGAFGGIAADDYFVSTLFADRERMVVEAATSVVHPPRNVRSLMAIRARVYRFNMADRACFGDGHSGLAERQRRALAVRLRHPRQLPSALAFAAINLLAKHRARLELRRGARTKWDRDQSSRTAP